MKLKTLVIGIIIGVMLTSSIGVFAEGIAVLLNPYPILVNGQTADIEAYNINGRTFLALGDVAKYFNATATLNETTKQIEVNTISTSVEGVTSMSTTAAVEYNYTTKLPIGAEVTEYKGSKNAVAYNNNIYLPLESLSADFGIKFKYIDVKANTTTFVKDNNIILADLKISGNHFLNSSGKPFYNVNLFSEVLGE
jgi:hypothetical protein